MCTVRDINNQSQRRRPNPTGQSQSTSRNCADQSQRKRRDLVIRIPVRKNDNSEMITSQLTSNIIISLKERSGFSHIVWKQLLKTPSLYSNFDSIFRVRKRFHTEFKTKRNKLSLPDPVDAAILSLRSGDAPVARYVHIQQRGRARARQSSACSQ